jgi:hypothetical protein
MPRRTFDFALTTQGPAYPPSEVMDQHGNFIVIGKIFTETDGKLKASWGEALVAASSPLPPFGELRPYTIVGPLRAEDDALVLYTLPLPLPCSNYPMLFAPEQQPNAHQVRRRSAPFHLAHVPDGRPGDGRLLQEPVTLGAWRKARGQVSIQLTSGDRAAEFTCDFEGLIPRSLYTVMALRQRDLDPRYITRPGPLGIPNAFVTDPQGRGHHYAVVPNAFPRAGQEEANPIINIILLWMSSQSCYGGAIGLYGLGGDIHAQLKLKNPIEGFETKV